MSNAAARNLISLLIVVSIFLRATQARPEPAEERRLHAVNEHWKWGCIAALVGLRDIEATFDRFSHSCRRIYHHQRWIALREWRACHGD